METSSQSHAASMVEQVNYTTAVLWQPGRASTAAFAMQRLLSSENVTNTHMLPAGFSNKKMQATIIMLNVAVNLSKQHCNTAEQHLAPPDLQLMRSCRGRTCLSRSTPCSTGHLPTAIKASNAKTSTARMEPLTSIRPSHNAKPRDRQLQQSNILRQANTHMLCDHSLHHSSLADAHLQPMQFKSKASEHLLQILTSIQHGWEQQV